jgi:hypothetical protein
VGFYSANGLFKDFWILSQLVEWDGFKVPEITEEEGKFKGIPWRARHLRTMKKGFLFGRYAMLFSA